MKQFVQNFSGSDLDWLLGMQNKILVKDYVRTIPPNFGGLRLRKDRRILQQYP